jgi:hypothetical protein
VVGEIVVIVKMKETMVEIIQEDGSKMVVITIMRIA